MENVNVQEIKTDNIYSNEHEGAEVLASVVDLNEKFEETFKPVYQNFFLNEYKHIIQADVGLDVKYRSLTVLINFHRQVDKNVYETIFGN
ncbi:hypothetical protein LC087_10105 [Bacillus carboniphilus]|uniref:Uncharacterized protein n=1 Tax=Bacillus carboniphilus TaxID=86663 RepID=A0ABY9JUE3_9BACI|nr:hypothetical protein [Bacillus carboniphilus]WLR41285.1 hypothetical protein LC087_10105 [Bacillus carboniphilus]